MLSVLVELLNKEFSGFLERNGERLGVDIDYAPEDVMVLGPIPTEMGYGPEIKYMKLEGHDVSVSASESGEFNAWEAGKSEGVQTLRLLDPRLYAMLFKEGKLQEHDGIPIEGGLTRVFADFPTMGLGEFLGMPDPVARMMEAMTSGRVEVTFDINQDGRPQRLIRKELAPSEDEIAVHFTYPQSPATPPHRRFPRPPRIVFRGHLP
jgi:hypothetical protein